MAGMIQRLLPITVFDYSGLAGTMSTTVTLYDRIDVSRWKQVTLIVRAHSNLLVTTAIGSAATVNLQLVATFPSDDDPSKRFDAEGTYVPNLPSLTLNSSTVGGTAKY